MLRQSLASFVQKVGLALSFIYATLLGIFRPVEVVDYYPRWSYWNTNITSIVTIGSIVTLAMAIWVISNKQKFLANLISAILVGLASLFNITNLHFLLALSPVFALALSLTIRYYPRVRVIDPNSNLTPSNPTI